MKRIAIASLAALLTIAVTVPTSAQQRQRGQQREQAGQRSCKKLIAHRKGLRPAGKIAAQQELLMQGKCDVVS